MLSNLTLFQKKIPQQKNFLTSLAKLHRLPHTYPINTKAPPSGPILILGYTNQKILKPLSSSLYSKPFRNTLAIFTPCKYYSPLFLLFL